MNYFIFSIHQPSVREPKTWNSDSRVSYILLWTMVKVVAFVIAVDSISVSISLKPHTSSAYEFMCCVASGRATIKDSYHWLLWSCWTRHCCTHYWAEQSLAMATENREIERDRGRKTETEREEENAHLQPFKWSLFMTEETCGGSHKVWDIKPPKRHRDGCHPCYT